MRTTAPTVTPAPPLPENLFEMDGLLWLSHCMDGPTPRAAAESLARVVRKEICPWEMDWESDFLSTQNDLRAACASLVNGAAADISLSPCTSTGIQAVAQGFPWREGDEVLVPQGEFPTNAMPWEALIARGVTCRAIPLWKGQKAGTEALETLPPALGPLPFEQALQEAIGPRTRLVALSWVRFQDGLMLDLESLGRICQGEGIPLVVDAIQGMGTFQPDLRGVSALATGGHKGLLGPQGQGFLWTSDSFRAELAPAGTWLSMGASFSQEGTQGRAMATWAEDGRKLEPGSPSILGCAALLDSLGTLGIAGVPAIQQHVIGLQTRLLEVLRHHPLWRPEAERLLELRRHDRLGAILCFHHSAVGMERLKRHLEQGVRGRIRSTIREGYLRLAFHGWHSEKDLERVVDWMASV